MALTATVLAGATIAESEQITAQKLNALGAPTVDITGTIDTADITDAAVTGGKIASDTIENANVKSTAAIAFSKMETTASTKVVAGNASNAAAPHEVLGDVTLSRAFYLDVIVSGSVAVGDHVRFSVSGTPYVGKVVKTEAVTGSTRVYLDMLTSNPPSVGTDTQVYKQATTVTFSNVGSTVPFGAGARITQGDYSADITAVNITGSGPYTVSMTVENIVGAFDESGTLTIGGVGYSTSISALTLVGATYPAGAAGNYSSSSTVLVTSETNAKSNYVDGSKIVTGTSDTAGRVLTSAGPDRLATWSAIASPLCRGGMLSTPDNFWNDRTAINHGHASAWAVVGWGEPDYIYLYHPSFSAAWTGAIARDLEVGEELIFAELASPTPIATPGIPLFTPVTIEEIAAASYGSVNCRRVKVKVTSTDLSVAIGATSTPASSTKGWACRKAADLTGGKLFRSPQLREDGTTNQSMIMGDATPIYTGMGGYVVILETAADDTTYTAIINASGLHDAKTAYGYPASSAANVPLYGADAVITYKTTQLVGFTVVHGSTAGNTYDPRKLDIYITA
jgi:hypothetical protein